MIDENGYRFNVAIILVNDKGQVAWFKRKGQSSSQFPQGGVNEDESLEQGMFRELAEETGLEERHVELLGRTSDWLYYDLPSQHIKEDGICIGQKQMWFLLKLKADDSHINLSSTSDPEFESWQWVEKQQAVNEIIYFKQDVYKRALASLESLWP